MLYNIFSAVVTATQNHANNTPLTVREALSGVSGSISLACWLFLLVPQLIENYRNQSAEAISLAFVIVWFLGDLANLIGALWADLVPTVILIAVYFCISDALLLGQILYYGIRNKRREGRNLLSSVKDTVVEQDTGNERFSDAASDARRSIDDTTQLERETSAQETEPLLSRRHSRGNSYGAYSLPGSGDPKAVREQVAARRRSSAGSQGRPRRKSSSTAAASAQQETLAKIFEDGDASSVRGGSSASKAAKNTCFILSVVLIGSVGWLVAYKTRTWKPVPPPTSNLTAFAGADSNPTSAQFLGYASAVLYLTARLPQIWKNYREQSCEGLSILFFILSLMGNGTYGAGILFHSTERAYVMKNIPWLLGSLGTMFEDVIVFYQFRLYKDNIEGQSATTDNAPPSTTEAR